VHTFFSICFDRFFIPTLGLQHPPLGYPCVLRGKTLRGELEVPPHTVTSVQERKFDRLVSCNAAPAAAHADAAVAATVYPIFRTAIMSVTTEYLEGLTIEELEAFIRECDRSISKTPDSSFDEESQEEEEDLQEATGRTPCVERGRTPSGKGGRIQSAEVEPPVKRKGKRVSVPVSLHILSAHHFISAGQVQIKDRLRFRRISSFKLQLGGP